MDAQSISPIRVRPEVEAFPPYRQGAVPSKPGFKLSSNENPFPTLKSVEDAVASVPVGRYAGQAMPELKTRIGKKFGLSEGESLTHVHLAAGSVSILYQLIQAVAGAGDEVVYAWPSFEGYPLLGIASGAKSVAIPLREKAEHDLDAMAVAVTERTRAIILCSPNNPTGPVIAEEEFKNFMGRVPNDVLVILDEAYREFVTDPNAVKGEEVIANYKNLVVLRTFSKAYGLASLRIGYGVGHPAVWEAARVTGIPLSITGQAEAAALAVLEEDTELEIQKQVSLLIERRESLVAGLRNLGLEVAEAQGNFVWLPLKERSAEFAEFFTEEGTLVRPFAGEGVRITVAEEESIQEVLRIAKEFLSKVGA